MIVLGVDPGSVRTGWGVLSGTSSRPEIVDCGVIRLGSSLPFAQRLARLSSELTELIGRYSLDSAGVESPFHGASARSALQLAHARGVILAVLAGDGLPVAEYSPASVKKAVTGNGRADKDQVGRMVVRLLGGAARDRPDDLTDALAVALCHLAGAGYRSAVESSERSRTTVRRAARTESGGDR